MEVHFSLSFRQLCTPGGPYYNRPMQSDDGAFHKSCPIDQETKEWIDARASWLVNQFGSQWIRQCDVAVPTNEFFPTSFQGTEEEARDLLNSICDHLKLNAGTIDLEFFSQRQPLDGRQTFDGVYAQVEGRHQIWIEVGLLDDPPALAATMAHELCHVHLLGHGRLTGDEDDHEPLTDLLTVFLGMGVLTANAAIYAVNWQSGTLESWQVGRRGYCTMPMFGYALALFSRFRDEFDSPWPKYLRLDVRDSFQKSLRYFDKHGMPNLRTVIETSSRPSIIRPDNDHEDEQFDEFETELDDTVCCYCGEPLDPNDDQDICELCQESIDENDRELELERNSYFETTERYQSFLRWFFLVGAIVFAMLAVLSWLGIIK